MSQKQNNYLRTIDLLGLVPVQKSIDDAGYRVIESYHNPCKMSWFAVDYLLDKSILSVELTNLEWWVILKGTRAETFVIHFYK